MTSTTLRANASFAAIILGLLTAAPGGAQSRNVTRPNIDMSGGATSVTLNGNTFINQGLVGAGRLDANIRDFRNETLGSFSGMAIDLANWHRNADGSYAGRMYTLPDRGPFDGAIDYRNRVHIEDIRFAPLTGTGTLPQAPSSQSQLAITPTGGFTLKDANGVEMTGRDPGANIVTWGGIAYPVATDGTAAGHVSLDAEALAFRPDGSFYVSDEYAAGIYHFDASGKQIGAIQTVPALLPRNAAGAIDFNSNAPGVSGRRNNQGLEAMALTPDNRKLVTILQSATVQDTNGANQQTRNNTRILIYDVSSNATPANPVGHYVLQLPVFTNNGNGAAANRTAAQSEMLALNDTQFLVLARDGLGRGVAASASTSSTPVYKSILLVDTAGATNLAGTAYETGTTPVATNGTLVPAIVPVQQVEMVNLLNPTQLAKVGMNLNRLPVSNSTTLSEKIEAMALAPVLEENAPQDFFLFVGNDNDFLGTNICFNGSCSASGAQDGTGNNDSVMLVYRLTLPTYVDPQALGAMNRTAPDILYGTRLAMTNMALSTALPAMRFINGQRDWEGQDDRRHAQLWLDTDWNRIGAGVSPVKGIDVDTVATTVGLDVLLAKGMRVGATGGYRKTDGRLGASGSIDADAWTVGGYAGIETARGIYAQGSVAWLGDVRFDRIVRNAAYGQQAFGKTKGHGLAAAGEIGWSLPVGRVKVTPFAGLEYAKLNMDDYTESGASVSNIVFADRDFTQTTANVGGEMAIQLGAIRPAIRGGYSFEKETGDETAPVRLASARHAMGSAVLELRNTARDSAFGEISLEMRSGALSAYALGRGRWGRGDDEAGASIGIGYAF